MMMNKFFSLTSALSFALLLSACGNSQIPGSVYRSQPAAVRAQSVSPAQAPIQLIVRFRKNVSRTDLLVFSQKYQLQTLRYQPEIDAFIMTVRTPVSSQAELQTMVNRMQQEPVAALVEVNQQIQVTPVYDMTTMPVLGQ